MRCVVPYCCNDSTKTSQEITYHKFPKEPTLRAAWLDVLHISGWEPQECSPVCSDHFQREDLVESSGGRHALRAGAVPVAHVLVCRICLATHCKLFKMTSYSIVHREYKTLTGLLIDEKDNLPPYLCYECVQRLLNCGRFRTTGLQAHSILRGILRNHGHITLQLITNGFQSSRNGNTETMGTGGQADTQHLPILHGDIPGGEVRAANDVMIQRENVQVQDATNNEMLCRVCIATDCKLYRMTTYNILHREYKTLTGLSIDEEESLPPYLCYECVQRLLNCARFRTAGLQAHSILQGILRNHGHITLQLIPKGFQNALNGEKEDMCTDGQADTQHAPILHGDAIDGVESERDWVHRESLTGEDIIDDVKVESECVKQYSGDQRSVYVEVACGDGFLGFSDNRLPSAGAELSGATHVNARRGGPASGLYIDQSLLTPSADPAGTHCYSCDICSYTTTHKSHLTRHYSAHSGMKPYACDVCDISFFKKVDLKEHFRRHAGTEPHSCAICRVTFRDKNSLAAHFETHSVLKPFSCGICQKTFTQKGNLFSHVRTHSGEKPFSCDICHKVFSQQTSLRGHLRTHTGEKPFSCDICQKSFTQKTNLNAHVRTHFGETAVTCDICHGVYSNKYSLRTHLKTHFRVRPFSCDLCHKTFSHKIYLISHVRTHTGEKPFSCDICHMAFVQKSNLKAHLSTHCRDKPFSCDICHKSFKRKKNLTAHVRLHSGDKAFPCHICQKSFRFKKNLIGHVKSHFVEEPTSDVLQQRLSSSEREITYVLDS